MEGLGLAGDSDIDRLLVADARLVGAVLTERRNLRESVRLVQPHRWCLAVACFKPHDTKPKPARLSLERKQQQASYPRTTIGLKYVHPADFCDCFVNRPESAHSDWLLIRVRDEVRSAWWRGRIRWPRRILNMQFRLERAHFDRCCTKKGECIDRLRIGWDEAY